MRVILVPVADRPECARALQTAFDLGVRLGASISGCHMRPQRHSEVSLSSAFAESTWRRKNTRKAPAAAKSLYRQIAEQNGYEVTRRSRAKPSALWAEKVGSPDRLLSIFGPLADLIVVSRPAKIGGVADMFMSAALIEWLRPVLILPAAGRKKIGHRIVIAWNQSGEAARTVTSVMPLLQIAEEVTIVTCGPEDKLGPKSTQLAAYLSHWGIGASRVQTPGRDVEAELLDAYRAAAADLLVGGAYSRSRWREKVFGGTSEYLLHKARIPVLLQHG
jgi:nucleotide-binding universal stress UspA family protein